MYSDLQTNQFLFNAIRANPYLQSLYEGLSGFLPGTFWFTVNSSGERAAFPPSENGKDRKFQASHPEGWSVSFSEAAGEGDAPLIRPCCAGYLEGVVFFRYHEAVLGGIGISHVEQKQRNLLHHLLRILEGYLTLLSVSLEDHDDLERVHNLWSETISEIDIHELLNRLIREFCSALHLRRAIIFLINDDGEFYPASVLDLPAWLLKDRSLNLNRYDYLERITDPSQVVLKLDAEDPLRQWLMRSLENSGNDPLVRETVIYAVPFFRRSYLIGVFVTITTPEFQLAGSKEGLTRMLAVGGAAALDHAMTVEKMNLRRKALATIHVVHRLISSSMTSNDLLPKIAQLTRQLLNARKCSIMLFDHENACLLPRVGLGLDKNEVGLRALELGEELPGWVAENYNPILYHPTDDKPLPWKQTGDSYPSESYLAVAMYDNDIEGVITVSEKQGEFTPGDREILVTFAEQAILAIKNARIHEGERTITVNALKSIANLIETHDPTKTGVTVEACEWAQKIAQQMNLNDREFMNLTYATLLRDTGMLRVLQANFTLDEHRRQGPQLSRKFVQSLGLSADVERIVYHANEAWNGEGYPEGLKGADIPLGSRIIAVANAFAILLKKWDELKPLSRDVYEKSFRIIARLSHRTYDPDVVNALGEVIRNREEERTAASS